MQQTPKHHRHGAEDSAQRTDLQALEGPRRGHRLSKKTIGLPHTPRSEQWGGGFLGPAGLLSGGAQAFTCASSARIWFFALCFLHIGEYRLDLTILARHIHNSTGISLVVARL